MISDVSVGLYRYAHTADRIDRTVRRHAPIIRAFFHGQYP
jgi:hypothetical protein